MTNWKAVIVGFILAIFVQFLGYYELLGLLIVGFITGFMAKEGAIGGLWNAALAGSLGTIISAILFVICVTVGGGLFGLAGGIFGFTISGMSGIVAIIIELIGYAIIMGITGAIGGAIASKN